MYLIAKDMLIADEIMTSYIRHFLHSLVLDFPHSSRCAYPASNLVVENSTSLLID